MNPNRFDQISRYFNERRVSRRAALAQGVGLAAGAATMSGFGSAMAQDATPEATPTVAPDAGDKTMYLFIQGFQSGNIAPATGEFGTHTVTLEQGLGQTIYFADRPSREVGTSPTPAFLDGLGFADDNPPNAALIIETAPGETDIAVVELFNPTYDEATHTATYDIAVLANWQNDLELGFQEAPTDLSELSTEFGAAHLFIDDCADRKIQCSNLLDNKGFVGSLGLQGFCYWWSTASCLPCTPKDAQHPWDTSSYWTKMCNDTLPACEGNRCQSSYE